MSTVVNISAVEDKLVFEEQKLEEVYCLAKANSSEVTALCLGMSVN